MLELLLIVVGFFSLIYGITFGRIEIGRFVLKEPSMSLRQTLMTLGLIACFTGYICTDQSNRSAREITISMENQGELIVKPKDISDVSFPNIRFERDIYITQ